MRCGNCLEVCPFGAVEEVPGGGWDNGGTMAEGRRDRQLKR
ncbi:MAG: 4Fe-4S binding protein [Enterocloster sp.]